MYILFIILILLIFLYILYIKCSEIDLFDTKYINKYDYSDQVVVIEKTLFSVTIARVNQDPEKIGIFYFLLNYTTGVKKWKN